MSKLPESQPLANLESIDRSLLHCFVAGPGLGEGIALALPDTGWVLVDCCRTQGGLPTEELFIRLSKRDERIVLAALTHAHEDHALGFTELLEALAPDQVGVPGNDVPAEHLLTAARAAVDSAKATDGLSTADVDAARGVEAVLAGIVEWERSHPGKVLGLRDGSSLQFGKTTIAVRAPDSQGMTRFFNSGALGRRFRRDANHLSLVLEVSFGEARLVLGGDLPRYKTNTTQSVETGWDLVMKRHGHLGEHLANKISHHGSDEAMHPALLTTASRRRAWWVTPYNSSKLPRVAAHEGMPRLLQQEPSIHLTAVPASKKLQAESPDPGRVTLSSLVDRVKLQPTGVPFLDAGVQIRPGSATEPEDCVWGIAVDDAGEIRGRWRGRAALEVTV